jgi:hypothetical protein
MEIASEHAECQGLGAGEEVEEGLFLDRIGIQRCYVPPGYL